MAATKMETMPNERKEPYQGEKRRFMREGYGTYVYENAFFRYEGEWMKGKKHGHGKLVMKDGTHYEGQFMNGEINGNGYKFFSSSNAKYTGQFLNGEMHGHGIMYYVNGNIYEGQWYKNKKQGFGILRTSEKAVYEGTFHGHVRDGEGAQTYDNGDRYEGYWVLDKRQGHGDLWCADGSHYSGQFLNDLFNGEGVIKHASGIVYRGQWINGYPITMATKIALIVEEAPMIIRQGHSFAIRVECRNEDGDVVPDQGRELQVSAGFKYRVPKQGSALFDVIEDVEDRPIATPFGYDVVLYPITDQLPEVSVPSDGIDSKMSTLVKNEEEEDKGEDDVDEEGVEEMKDGKEITEDADGMDTTMENTGMQDLNAFAEDGGSRPLTPAEPSEDEKDAKEETTTTLPLPAPTRVTIDGVCEWTNLQLAPAPPMYRPFAIMEEEAGPKKKSKLAQIRDKIDDDSSDDEKERKNSQLNAAPQKVSHDSEKTVVSDEKIARTGEYVLMVTDVTNPSFLGYKLDPAFLLLKLKKPKKTIVKKAKWDTQRHIAMAMSRSNIDA